MKKVLIFFIVFTFCLFIQKDGFSQYIINTIAGTDSSGYNGDNIPAVNAKLKNPLGVTVSKNGCIFIADTYNNRIRKVDTNGIITTIAGGPTAG